MDDRLSVSIQISETARSLMLLVNERPHMIAISSVLMTETCVQDNICRDHYNKKYWKNCFLIETSAEELVSLRKHQEDSNRLAVGNKLYTHSESQLDDGVLECALENYKCTLNKKRAGRIYLEKKGRVKWTIFENSAPMYNISNNCDLMQAEWNAELNAVIVSKLKGKFVQHMGCMVNGKYALSPEESIFLLENGCIEIINGGMPMSTEEAYNCILKGPLSLEKYQVYSHLSQLGFIVVSHQTESKMFRCSSTEIARCYTV
ncbi:UNVERIFIED_CONTAM: Tsen54 [Trichonephila clavipes]